MKQNFMKKIVSLLLAMTVLITYSIPSFSTVFATSVSDIPAGFTNVAIGNNDGTGKVAFDNNQNAFNITGSGNNIGKGQGITDSYQFVSYNVTGDCTIIARLADFDMSQAPKGQAGVFIRENNTDENADYIGVYVDPYKDQYRCGYRDNTQGKTGASILEGLNKESKGKYIKIEKKAKSYKIYVAEDAEFNNIIATKSKTIPNESNSWNVGFVVANGGSSAIATASFDNVIIKDSEGVVYEATNEEVIEIPEEVEIPELPEYVDNSLPKGFENSSIGNNSENVSASFDKNTKQFTVNGSGTYIGKDSGATDNYQFVNYKVEGNATIVARLVDFDMSQAPYGQAGIFIREDATTNNANYFGVYVEPSKNQYRYAYRDNAVSKSGAAPIAGLTANSKNQYIKIEKVGNSFRLSISEDSTFPSDKTIVKTQTVTSTSNTWNVGFVVSNGGSENPAVAKFDNVKIENENKVYYDSTVKVMPLDTVENVKATASDAKVTLTWDAVENVKTYIVKRATSKTGEFSQIAEVSETTYVDTDVENFDTYYYKITAKSDNAASNDSKIVIATPNNSNPSNIQYEDNAAVFNMTKEPNDTVSNNVITLEGSTDKDGSITIVQNGETKVKFDNKSANETFSQRLTLELGRNTIEIYHTTEDGKKTIKSYNIVYLENTNYNKIVDTNYTGVDGEEVNGIQTYKTIAAAINSVSTKNTERVVIFVKNGTYKEKLTIQSPYISLVGEDSKKTIITYDDAAGTINPATNKQYGTSGSSSVTIKSKAVGFTAENLTIENAFEEKGKEGEQAVALNNQADKSIFVNCRFIANQDTLLADASSSSPARQYYYKCYIEGDVDFIFGRAQAVFNDCDIASFNRGSSTNNGYITAADTWDTDSYGYVIMNSRLIGLDNIADNSVSLGRPWRPSSQTRTMTPAVAYINCYMGSHISTKGWDDMGPTSLASTSRFYEYGSYGPGAKTSETRTLLNNKEIKNYTIDKVLGKDSATLLNNSSAYASDWMPMEVSSDINITTWYKNTVNVEKIELNKSELTINMGDSSQLIATINPENTTNQTVVFESNDNSVVTVDESGNINAVGVGTATITVRCGNKQATCVVTVSYKPVELNIVPEITAEDVTILQGENFDEKANVTATDSEDGDLTNSIEVIENTVDTTTPGEYKVVYKVTDSQGATVIKTIIVTVEAQEIVTPEEDDTTEGEDITTPEEDNTTEGEDITTPEEDNTTEGEDITTPEEDDTTEGEDITTPEEDDTTEGEDITTPEEDNTIVDEETSTEIEDSSNTIGTSAPNGNNLVNGENGEQTSENDSTQSENNANKPSQSVSPQTGDKGIGAMVAIIAVAVVVLFVVKRRKK